MTLSVKTQGWASTLTTPVVGDPANQAHLHMQAKARDIGERFGEEHALNVSTTLDGQHSAGSARGGYGATATRPPNRFTSSQDGPSQGASGGNERGRLFYDETRFSLQFSTIIGVLEVWQDIVPQGLICMWSGLIANIPNGWALCNGAGGTPNLSGRFIVGYDAGDADYSTIGNVGGSKTQDGLTAHTHAIPTKSIGYAGGGNNATVIDSSGAAGADGVTRSTGSGTTANRPPYYTLAFIIKL